MKSNAKKRSVISLMYHDVVGHTDHQTSGFPGADAALYKLEPEKFEQHLSAISSAVPAPPILVTQMLSDEVLSSPPWMITFDDGGASFYTEIADRVEALGWRAHFFITTDYIGKAAFMTREQIRDLHRRGHVIGSHSCSHPLRFADRSANEMKQEWSESIAVLSELLGTSVQVASIPGGQYSQLVVETAAAAGIKALFTSEPVTRCVGINGCLVLGRYTINRWLLSDVAAMIAVGKTTPRLRQLLWWNTKKVTKKLGGEQYLRIRKKLFA